MGRGPVSASWRGVAGKGVEPAACAGAGWEQQQQQGSAGQQASVDGLDEW